MVGILPPWAPEEGSLSDMEVGSYSSHTRSHLCYASSRLCLTVDLGTGVLGLVVTALCLSRALLEPV